MRDRLRRPYPGAVVQPTGIFTLSCEEIPGRTAWQSTNVTRGDVLAFASLASECVALLAVDGATRVLHSFDEGLLWASPWPDLPRNSLVTALAAGPGAAFVGLLSGGVLWAPRADGAEWRPAGGDLPEDGVVTALAASQHEVFAAIRGRGIFRLSAGAWSIASHPGEPSCAGVVVTSLSFRRSRLVAATTRGLWTLDETGCCVLSGIPAIMRPIGVVEWAHDGLLAWTPSGVFFSEEINGKWMGLPLPPEGMLVRSAAPFGSSVLVVLQGHGQSTVHRWRPGLAEWEKDFGGPGESVSIHAASDAVLLGLGEGGIDRTMARHGESLSRTLDVRVERSAPHHPDARIQFVMQRAQDVSVFLCHPDGTIRREMALGKLHSGRHETVLENASIAPGIYTVIVRAGGLDHYELFVVLD